MDIIDSLREIRRGKKITQKKLSEYLGITIITINRYEVKKRKIPYEIIHKYAEYLGYEIRLLKK